MRRNLGEGDGWVGIMVFFSTLFFVSAWVDFAMHWIWMNHGNEPRLMR